MNLYEELMQLSPEDQDAILDEATEEELAELERQHNQFSGGNQFRGIPRADEHQQGTQGAGTESPTSYVEKLNPDFDVVRDGEQFWARPKGSGDAKVIPWRTIDPFRGAPTSDEPLDLPFGVRFAVENFGDDQSLDFLEKYSEEYSKNKEPKYDFGPEGYKMREGSDKGEPMEFQFVDGEYWGRPKSVGGSTKVIPWKSIDPQTGFNPIDDPVEALSDVADFTVEGVKGVYDGYNVAKAGVGGALAAAPLGPVAQGAAALSMGSGAGVLSAAQGEAAQQAVGKMLGVRDDYDTDKIRNSAIISGMIPVPFGTGAVGKTVLKEAADRGLSKFATEQLVKSQSGVLSRGASATTQGLGSIFSGIPAREIENLRNNLPEIKELEKGGGESVDAFVRDTMSTVKGQLLDRQKGLGDEIEEAMRLQNANVDLKPIYRTVLKQHKKLMERARSNDGTQADRAAFDAYREQVLPLFTKEIKSKVDRPTGAFKNSLNSSGLISRIPITKTKETTSLAFTKQLTDLQTAMRLKRRLAAAAKRLQIDDRFKGENIDAQEHIHLLDDLASEADKVVENSLKSLDLKMGNTNSVYGTLLSRYKDLKAAQAFFKPYMYDPNMSPEKVETIARQLRNLHKPSNATRRGRMSLLDKKYGTDVVGRSDLLTGLATFGDPALTPVSQFGASAGGKSMTAGLTTSSALANIMMAMGLDPQWAFSLGGLIGFPAGQGLVSPAGIRKYTSIGKPFRDAANNKNLRYGIDATGRPAAKENGEGLGMELNDYFDKRTKDFNNLYLKTFK